MPAMPGNDNKKYLNAPLEDANGSIEMNKVDKTAMTNSMSNHPEVGKNLTVYYSGDPALRKWTHMEKYLIALCILLFLACTAFIVIAFTRDRLSGNKKEYCLTQSCVRTAGHLLEAMDLSIDPCEDFYHYACGTWNKNHIIPEDKAMFTTFDKLIEKLFGKLKHLLEEDRSENDTNATLKAKSLYKSCINIKKIEQVGDRPLREILSDMGGWPVLEPDWSDEGWVLEDVLSHLLRNFNAHIILHTFVAVDDKNSSIHTLQLDQPGLGMPSPEYYLDGENKQAYLHFMINIAQLLGADPVTARRDMEEALALEVKIANVTRPQSERHDMMLMYSKHTARELQILVPEINWLQYLNGFMPVEIKEDENIVSFAMDYLKDMARLIKVQKPRVITNYLLWRLIQGLVPEMTEEYQQELIEYNRIIRVQHNGIRTYKDYHTKDSEPGHNLQGISQNSIRWQKCVEYVNQCMGMAVGRMFVRHNFPKKSKEVALEMIHNIRGAFNEILEATEWMDEDTKKVAKGKANAMNERIGYPEFILDPNQLDKKYDGLNFYEDEYFQNILRVERDKSQRSLKKLRDPVMKDEWDQEPAIVNAFYNPNTNDIVFPAAILQPMFYDEDFPKSLNYGGIGVVIGHEITHGFDDKGRQYDKNGNLRQWWNNKTVIEFRKRAKCMIDQYNQYILEPFGLRIDGKNTQGENIADNGGLKESFRAYKKWVSQNGQELPLPGIPLSHDQLFFLNYAQIWCGIMRTEGALHKIRTSVHSPEPFRVIGPLSNSHDFAEAYNCPAGSRMNPVEKCSVW